jgi:hypothetical protein
MVTEVNCSWDKYPDYLPPYETYCDRITGQVDGYGEGAIKMIMENPKITDFAWFVMWRDVGDVGEKEMCRLLNNEGELLPAGRALVNQLDPEAADCHADPKGPY